MPKCDITILIVDDEQSQREGMHLVLGEQGYQVVEAASYIEGMSRYNEWAGRVQLLLVDISLPEKNGYELAAALLAIDPKLKVLFISGQAGAEWRRFYNMPSVDSSFLEKPFAPAELLQRIQDILESAEPATGIAGAGA